MNADNEATATESQNDFQRSLTMHKEIKDDIELAVKQKM